MLINELPEDCLLTIFYYIKDLEDLINCFKVCEKWCNLIVGRTKRVKYLINQSFSPDCVSSYVRRPIDVTCLSNLFPNLRIMDLFFLLHEKLPIEDMVKLIRDSESLKGIIFPFSYYLDFELIPEIASLEMLSTGSISPNISGIYENVKQLHLYRSNLYLCELAHFPNLERLHFYMKPDTTDYEPDYNELSEPYSDAPVLANLKILEMGMSHCHWEDGRCSFVFMDSCSALQSVHIRFKYWSIEINYSVKLANLQDMVLEFHHPIEWNDLRRLMSKYPNLKHLAIRGYYLEEEHIKQLILILPKLTLLDVRESYGSYGITQEAADHVRDYCKRHGRSIKIYFEKDEQLESDWPEKICRGFDFMKHCFFNSFDGLPYFLDPIDD